MVVVFEEIAGGGNNIIDAVVVVDIEGIMEFEVWLKPLCETFSCIS